MGKYGRLRAMWYFGRMRSLPADETRLGTGGNSRGVSLAGSRGASRGRERVGMRGASPQVRIMSGGTSTGAGVNTGTSAGLSAKSDALHSTDNISQHLSPVGEGEIDEAVSGNSARSQLHSAGYGQDEVEMDADDVFDGDVLMDMTDWSAQNWSSEKYQAVRAREIAER